MAQPKKSQIKKLIEELHAKRNADQAAGGHESGKAPAPKEYKGAKQSGRYRPKI